MTTKGVENVRPLGYSSTIRKQTKGQKMINENTIYATDEVCWAVENDDLCDGYGCAPCSIEIDGYFTPAYRL